MSRIGKAPIDLPEGVTFAIDKNIVTVKGPKGEITKDFFSEKVTISAGSGKITISALNNTKRERKIAGSFKAHIQNILKGVVDGHHSKMKILSGHFPMTVKKDGQQITITNFLGEKIPRKSKILNNTQVDIKGDLIVVQSPDIEKAGQCAANIEKGTKVRNKDRRIYQDGIFIVERPRRKFH